MLERKIGMIRPLRLLVIVDEAIERLSSRVKNYCLAMSKQVTSPAIPANPVHH